MAAARPQSDDPARGPSGVRLGQRMTAYALTNAWERARRRLDLIEDLQDPASRRRISALGLGPGWRCLELGAGGGSIARWLCRAVAPSGSVLATDLDTRFLEEIREPNLEVMRHDILHDDLPAGAFDLVHARWLLHHLATPEPAIDRMLACLRPNGWLVLEELDMFPVDASGSLLYRDLMVAATAVIEARSGGSYRWARRLPDIVAARGLAEIGAECDVPVVNGGSPRAEFLELTCQQVREPIVGSGRLTAERFDKAIALLRDPNFRGFSSAHMTVWGRRPKDHSGRRFPLGRVVGL